MLPSFPGQKKRSCNRYKSSQGTEPIAMFLVTSPIVINVPTRGLLVVETMHAIVRWLENLNNKRNMTSMFVNKKHRYRRFSPCWWLVLFVHQHLSLSPLLSVPIEIGCKPPIFMSVVSFVSALSF